MTLSHAERAASLIAFATSDDLRRARALLDEMAILAIGGGHVEALGRLLDAGDRVDGDPDSDEIPLGQACWRRRVEMTRELVRPGAALAFPGGGTAVGAALHGSRHCHHP